MTKRVRSSKVAVAKQLFTQIMPAMSLTRRMALSYRA